MNRCALIVAASLILHATSGRADQPVPREKRDPHEIERLLHARGIEIDVWFASSVGSSFEIATKPRLTSGSICRFTTYHSVDIAADDPDEEAGGYAQMFYLPPKRPKTVDECTSVPPDLYVRSGRSELPDSLIAGLFQSVDSLLRDATRVVLEGDAGSLAQFTRADVRELTTTHFDGRIAMTVTFSIGPESPGAVVVFDLQFPGGRFIPLAAFAPGK